MMLKKKNIYNQSINNTTKYDNIFNNNNILGFWIYLMSDCILFATIFSVYCVMSNSAMIYNHLFNLKWIFIETIILLFSSVCYGILVIYTKKKNIFFVYFFLLLTFIFGLIFVLMELYEFHHMIQLGFSPKTNGFFSSFFTLVGMHGIHVIIGLLWLIGIFFQLTKLSLDYNMYIKILCLGLFWHFLDIIWVCLFTIVYLIGSVS